MLPDDVLLEIFDFYVGVVSIIIWKPVIESWITLAHVCRRWRTVVFQSQHRLNLRLVCTLNTRTRDMDVWPPLPLIIKGIYGHLNRQDTLNMDNIIAALEHNDRVSQIQLRFFTISQFEYVTNSAAMQNPFPELTYLHLSIHGDDGLVLAPMLPDSFLGGTAPRLQTLVLIGIPFSGLPKLFLSATHIVHLNLSASPRSGYIPPELMATSLSALTNLGSLSLQFRYPQPRPTPRNRRPAPAPLTRSILPRLLDIRFKGASEYLEDILARIDAPRLYHLYIIFFNQIIFDTPQVFRLINRSPMLRPPLNGHIEFNSRAIIIKFPLWPPHYHALSVEILCTTSEWQLSSLEQVCSSSLPPLSRLEILYIFEDSKDPPRWQDDVENTLWLELLRPFTAVNCLLLGKELELRIVPALQELVGERTTEVLPILNIIKLVVLETSRHVETSVAARRLAGHPVTVCPWDSQGLFRR